MAQLTGPMAYPQATSANVSLTSTEFQKIALGTRARDAQGNEFVYCSFAAVHHKGETLQYSSAFAASDLTDTTVGVPVGVLCGETAASSAGWLQIYGVCPYVTVTTGTSAGPVQATSTTNGISRPITLSAGTNVMIMGFYLGYSTSSSGTTDATSTTGFGVTTAQLNYPFISGEYAGITS